MLDYEKAFKILAEAYDEDAAQDAFVKLLSRSKDLPPIENEMGWLRSAAYTQYRAARRHNAAAPSLHEPDMVDTVTPEDIIIAREQIELADPRLVREGAGGVKLPRSTRRRLRRKLAEA